MMTPNPNDIYRHFKGNLYRIITIAQHADTGERMVVYQALYGENAVYVRALTDFIARLDTKKYPDAGQIHRFEPFDGVSAAPAMASPMAASMDQRREKAMEPPSRSDMEHEIDSTVRPVRVSRPVMLEKTSVQEPPAQEYDDEDLPLDPLLIEFLDISGHQERLRILERLRPKLNEEMIGIIAAALETELMTPASRVDAAYAEIRSYLLTMEKYERKHR